MGLIVDPRLQNSPALKLYMLVAVADLAATLALFIPFQHLPAIATARGVSKARDG